MTLEAQLKEIRRGIYLKALKYKPHNTPILGMLTLSEIASDRGADGYLFYEAGTSQDVIQQAKDLFHHREDLITCTAIEIIPEWASGEEANATT